MKRKKAAASRHVPIEHLERDEDHPPPGLRAVNLIEPEDDDGPDESIWDAHGRFGGGHGMTDPD